MRFQWQLSIKWQRNCGSLDTLDSEQVYDFGASHHIVVILPSMK